MGIAEANDDSGAAVFRLLVNCVICPRGPAPILPLTNHAERRVGRWIAKAGLRLMMAVLTFLSEKGISPAPAW